MYIHPPLLCSNGNSINLNVKENIFYFLADYPEGEHVNEAMDEEELGSHDDQFENEQNDVVTQEGEEVLDPVLDENHDAQLLESFDIISERVGDDSHMEDAFIMEGGLSVYIRN